MKFCIVFHQFFDDHLLIACVQCDAYIICQYCEASTHYMR